MRTFIVASSSWSLIVLVLGVTNAANVLVWFPFSTRSENNVIWPLTEGLAARGHSVTVVGVWDSKKQVRNAEEHNVAAVRDLIDAFFGSLFDIGPGSSSPVSLYRQVLALNHLTSTVCEETVKLGIWNRIARGQVKFDVVVMTPFFCECLTPVVDVVNASLIYLSTPGSFYDLTVDVTGFREPLSFCPNMMLPFTDRMSFAERGVNLALTLQTWLMRSVADAVLGDFRQDLADKIFKGMNVRSISEVQRDASLIFIGTPAVGVSTSRPSMPQTIQVGGMNLKEPKPLTQELEDWVSGSSNGFIYFSLGSAVQGKMMPEKFRKMFVEAFARFPQYRILWKWETEVMDDLPKHVKLSKWLPQQDLLGHKDIKLFITHGGLLSTQEATYHGVPVVGIPIGADQMLNMKRTENEGAGLTLEWSSLTTEGIYNAVLRVLSEPSFRENLKRRSAIMRDQPQTPLDRAVYWTEYVIRHKGAAHLRSAARDLTWWQYHLLDVWLFVGAVLLGFLLVAYFVTRCFLRCLGRKLFGVPAAMGDKKRQ